MTVTKLVVKKKKPRYRYCWVCQRKLWGDTHAVVLGPDGYDRIVHKGCKNEADNILKG